jgi:hypothetical protein
MMAGTQWWQWQYTVAEFGIYVEIQPLEFADGSDMGYERKVSRTMPT